MLFTGWLILAFFQLLISIKMASYLITGSSRGIGLALVALLASKPVSEVSKVFAAARKQNSSLEKLVQASGGRVEFIQLDVTDEQGSQQASKTVEKALNGKGLDVLINNAGIMNYTPNGIENMHVSKIRETLPWGFMLTAL